MAVTILPSLRSFGKRLIPVKNTTPVNVLNNEKQATINSVRDVEGILNARMNMRRKWFRRVSDKKTARQLYTIRAQRESSLETIRESIKGNMEFLADRAADGTKGILWRVLKVLGLIAVGWFLRNLPTWMGYAKEFIARITKIGDILKSFIGNMQNIMTSTGKVLTAFTDNILRLDFFDTEGDLKTSFGELIDSINGVGKDYEEAFKVFTEPLTIENMLGEKFGTYSGAYVPELGEDAPGRTDRPSSGESGSSGAWKPILELIAKAESVNGSYDSIYPSSIKPGLSNMTIAEADQWQERTARQRGSAAAGRYQFMNILEQAKSAGLSPNDKFSPENQDKMAIALIEKKRGVSLDTLKRNPTYAMTQLAKEWAGLPLASGKSFYSGDGRNKATVSVSEFRSAINNTVKNQQQFSSNSKGNAIFGETGKVGLLSQTALPKLPPTNTRPGKQHYGAAREGGRKHAGVDFDAGPNGKFYSRIGGVVTNRGNEPGGYFQYVDIYNEQLNVTERIAEGDKTFVKVGDRVKPGQLVQQGTNSTGVFHYEIRKGKNTTYGFAGTVDPIAFLNSVDQKIKGGNLKEAPPAPELPAPDVAIQRKESTMTPDMQMAPSREPQNIFAYVDTNKESPMVMNAPQSRGMNQAMKANSLNRYMKQMLLLELSYT